MSEFFRAVLWLVCLIPFCLAAKPLAPEDVPDPLKPWVGWVMHGHEQQVCPFLYNNAEDHRCAWPVRLELTLDERFGSFKASWRADAESWAALPGNAALWPQQVELDGKPAVVISRNDKPAVWLTRGSHQLTGRLVWERLPESLAIPRDSGLVAVALNGKPVQPVFNEQGDLWIQGIPGQTGEKLANTLSLRIFRRVVDEVPLRVVTRLDLEIAGEQREVVLAGALLADSIPLALSSPLPARLETDGQLRVLMRPGRWQIELVARFPFELNALAVPQDPADPWPREEIWSFEAHPENRMVEIEGAQTVDPRQTEMPDDWKNLPAFRLAAGLRLGFSVLRRGDPESSPDRLGLRRRIWLDFDGAGYTVRDEITGSLSRGWRLESLPDLDPGRVDVDGLPQLLTRMEDANRTGVELRRGVVNLVAESRGKGSLYRLSATGWARDFQHVDAEINLPPGWRLLTATGVDNAPDTWVGRWTLLDIFLVLIASLSVVRLRGWQSGALSAAALILLWQEPAAPRYVWLNILLCVALLPLLPEGRIRTAVKLYRNLAVLALAFIALPFMVEQIRLAIYPQLEWHGNWDVPGMAPGAAPEYRVPARREAMERVEIPAVDQAADQDQAAPPAESEGGRPKSDETYLPGAADSGTYERKPRAGGMGKAAATGAATQIAETDPNALTQTGPGLPHWHWNTLRLSWNGPVLEKQEVDLVLLSPSVNLAFNLLRVMLIVALAWILLPGGGNFKKFRWAMPGFSCLSLLLLVAVCVPEARAEMPTREMLDELQTRLLEPQDCLPECAQIPSLGLVLGADGLSQRLEVHAQAPVAIPLPAREDQWMPATVSVDGAASETLFRSREGALWLGLKAGRHEVVLNGRLPAREQVQLSLPLKPHRVAVEGVGWKVDGIRANGEPEGQLQLTRELQGSRMETGEESGGRLLPPFLEVRRTVRLGLDWRVATQVVRLSPVDAPIVAEIPLMEGESVTTPGLQVKGGKVAINLASGEADMSFESTLEKRPSVVLKAPQTTLWNEVWRADASPVWHLETEGIPVVRHLDEQNNRLPEWRPWPGESATLTVVRPQGVPGPTVTLESSRLRIAPGLRATDASLTLAIRSSQGGQHSVKLPAGAVLQSASIGGVVQPLRMKDRTVTIPIRPGSQNVTLAWRQESGISARFIAPEVNLGAASVNSLITVELGRDRWVLLVGGPLLGPAVLFWGVLVVLALVAWGLGRVDLTPLRFRQWFLLLIGLSQIELAAAAAVVGWLFALGWRRTTGETLNRLRFNCVQVGLAVLTVLALLSLFDGVRHGLLGLPDMQVAGNRSTAWVLNWYQDRSAATLSRPWLVSAPLWSYRTLMLLWALWLAYSLLDWLGWGWQCYATAGPWRPRPQASPAKGGWPDQRGD